MAGKPIKSDIENTHKKPLLSPETKQKIKQNGKKVINKFKTLTNYDAVITTFAVQKQNWKENWQKTREQNQLVDGIAKYEKKENKLAKKIAKMTEKYNEQYKDSEAALTITAKAKRFVKDFKLNIQKTRLDMTNLKKESITNYKQTLQEKIEQINKKPLEEIIEENKNIIDKNKPTTNYRSKFYSKQRVVSHKNQILAQIYTALENGDTEKALKLVANQKNSFKQYLEEKSNIVNVPSETFEQGATAYKENKNQTSQLQTSQLPRKEQGANDKREETTEQKLNIDEIVANGTDGKPIDVDATDENDFTP